MLSWPEVYYSLARYEKKRTGKDVALLVRGGRVRSIGYAGARVHETAVVNVLHNSGSSKNCEIYTTRKPTEMCIGLAWQCHVVNLFFLDGGAVKKIMPDDAGITSVLAVNSPANVSIVENIDDRNWRNGRAVLEQFPVSDTDFDSWYDWFCYRGTRLRQPVYDAWRDLDNCRDTYSARVNNHNETTMLTRISDGLAPDTEGPAGGATEPQKDQLWMKITLALAGAALWRSSSSGSRGDQMYGGHNIAALMVDSGDNIIGWGVNLNQLNACLHAETTMLLAYMRKNNTATGLPAAARIFSTLAPCHMCAGLISTLGSNNVVTIAHVDPRITNSALDRAVNGCRQTLTTLMPIVHEPITYVDARGALLHGESSETASRISSRWTDSQALYPETTVTNPISTPFAQWMNRQRQVLFEAWQTKKRAELRLTRDDRRWAEWLVTNRSTVPEHQASINEWLSEQQTRSGTRAVTRYLRESTRPSTLFTYNLTKLRALADYANPGEQLVIKRGVALLERLKDRNLIKSAA